MCISATTLLAAASVYNAVSSIQKGNEQKDFYRYQADQMEADSNAEKEAGEVRAGKIRKAALAQRSAATAALAASGVAVGAGTANKIDQEIDYRGEQDAWAEMLTGQRRAARMEQEAGLSRLAGERAQASGYRSAFGSLLQAGAQAKSGYHRAPVEDRTIPRIG